MAPLRGFGVPWAEISQPMPFQAVQTAFGPHGEAPKLLEGTKSLTVAG
jgi:hypothetical protein